MKTGKEGSFCDEKKDSELRKSKDEAKNTQGIKLLEIVEENGCEILNENMEGNEEGEHTLGKQGNLVIDYVLINTKYIQNIYIIYTKIKEKIRSCRIEERVESNILPLVVKIYGHKKS